MTTTDMLNRVNDALRTGDQLDLATLENQVSDMLMEDSAKAAWLALIETASETLDGAFR